MEAPRRVAELRRQGARRLSDAGVASPEHDAAALLAVALDTDPMMLPLVRELSTEQIEQYQVLVARRAGREPLQHILGTVDFYGVRLQVGSGVFIPRPETELLAQYVERHLRAEGLGAPRIVDLCAGSGAIGLSLERRIADVDLVLVEADATAARWAERNRAALGSRSTLVLADATAADLTQMDRLLTPFDVVVCNPPYVPDAAGVDSETRQHDPAAALWGGPDGLAVIRALTAVVAGLLRPGGLVAMEHDDSQGLSAPALFTAYIDSDHAPAFWDVQDHCDLTGRPRFLTARRW